MSFCPCPSVCLSSLFLSIYPTTTEKHTFRSSRKHASQPLDADLQLDRRLSVSVCLLSISLSILQPPEQRTFRSFRKHASQPLDADLQLDVPDTEDLVLGETDQLPTILDELHLDHTGHVTPQHLGNNTGG